MAKRAPSTHKRGNRAGAAGRKPVAAPRLAEKMAVVTGGNRGIGLAIAGALVAEGCSVLITGRDQAVLKSASSELHRVAATANVGGEIWAEPCELRDEQA